MPADHTALGPCFVENTCGLTFLADAADDRRVVSGGASGSFVGVVLQMAAPSRLAQLARWLSTALRIAAANRRLARAGAVPIGAYAVFPDTARPTFVYQLESAAGRYTEEYLLPVRRHGAVGRLRAVVSRLVCCDPAVAAVVVVGKRP